MNDPIIHRTLKGKPENRIPVWLMRQAGRYLPEYRRIRERAGSFLDLCFNPGLAAEVTLQPLKRFDLDAAILFSDILVVPHALGQAVAFVEGDGPRLDALKGPGDIGKLRENGFAKNLNPVFETVKRVRENLPEEKALIGFAGSPWTVASYMVEGKGGHDFEKIRAWAAQDPESFSTLIELLCRVTAEYLIRQAEAGAQILQLFESWAGVLAGDDFDRWIIAPNKKIVAAVKSCYPDIPVIGFPRTANTDDLLRFAAQSGCNALSLSHDIDPAFAQIHLPPGLCLQGNLDPALLRTGGPEMIEAASAVCAAFAGRPFIFNLGHGIIKDTPPDHVADLIACIRAYERQRKAA